MHRQWMLSSVILMVVIVAGCNTPGIGKEVPDQTVPATQQEVKGPSAPPANPVPGKAEKYVVVAANSTATYSVREKFFGKELNMTAVGKTSTIQGEIVLAKGVIAPSVVQVDLSTLTSDESRRDNQVRKALDTTTHKFAIFSITNAEGQPVLTNGQEVSLKLKGNMSIKGTEKPVIFDAKVTVTGDTLTLVADTTFKMSAFGVNPPSIANFVSVTDEVKLDVIFAGKRE